LQKRKSCSNPYTDDYCQSLVALKATYQTQAKACLQKSCSAVKACLKSAGTFNF